MNDELRVVEGTLTTWPAEALGALLGVTPPDLAAGEPLPLAWHWLYLLEHPRQQDLGPDGHPDLGVFPTPPAPGLRRMWAGGAINTLRPLLTGQRAVRRSRVVGRRTKRGQTGELVFLNLEHEILQQDHVAVRERQDIVYRQAATQQAGQAPAAAAKTQHADGEQRLRDDDWSVAVSPTLLFRFSALTYNAHRIHYDRDYARAVEGYPDLVTHGPLQAIAMAESLRSHPVVDSTRPARFEYRMVAPLFAHQGLVTRADVEDAGRSEGREPACVAVASARSRDGRRTASGTYHYL